jgi:2-amino-4-hydroxy-6-hydroxymethyldihydropteridine diphosphokinase
VNAVSIGTSASYHLPPCAEAANLSASMHTIAVVGLGANLGDRAASLRAAIDRLVSLPGVVHSVVSPFYETAPVGGPPQGDFLNAAVRLEIEPARSARSIVASLLAIEHEMGRERGERFGPRTIDLDLLWIDGEASTHPDAIVPHPRLHERAFALAPLVDVAPTARAPDGTLYARILEGLDRRGIRPIV